MKLRIREGGAGSGNFGHSGRPGEVGGSGVGAWLDIADRWKFSKLHSCMFDWVMSSQGEYAYCMMRAMNEIHGLVGEANMDAAHIKNSGSYFYMLKTATWDKFKEVIAYQQSLAKEISERIGVPPVLFRGISTKDANLFAKAKLGDTIVFRPLISTTTHLTDALPFARTRSDVISLIKLVNTPAARVFASEDTTPYIEALGRRNPFKTINGSDTEHEYVLHGNKDWALHAVEEEKNPGYSYFKQLRPSLLRTYVIGAA